MWLSYPFFFLLRQSSSRRLNTEDNEVSAPLTTPSPPATPDPGVAFECSDEGFFNNPKDCKKYFWCLDSGPANLGVVAHAFTCPSGKFFFLCNCNRIYFLWRPSRSQLGT